MKKNMWIKYVKDRKYVFKKTYEKIIKYVSTFKYNFEFLKDTNLLMEAHNICKYLELNNFNNCNNKEIYIKNIRIKENQFVKLLNNDNFKTAYKKVNSIYKDTFWEVIDQNIKQFKVDDAAIKPIMKLNSFNLNHIITLKKLNTKYSSLIKNIYLHNNNTAQIIIKEYAFQKEKITPKVYIPSFNEKEITKIFVKYIDKCNEVDNLNYIRYIDSDTFKITDEILLSSINKIKTLKKDYFARYAKIHLGVKVKFGDFVETAKAYNDGTFYIFEYDEKWIANNKDYSTLLNNFIYMFHYTNQHMILINYSKKKDIGTLESLMMPKLKNSYPIGIHFKQMQDAIGLQMLSYSEILKKYNIDLEDILKWFYNDYLKEEFEINNYHLYIPSKSNTYFEKCRILFPEVEGVLKQFKCYTLFNGIEHELIEVSKNQIIFDDIPSMLEKKYVYLNSNEETSKFYYLLFADESMLLYPNKRDYRNFFRMLLKENKKLTDFEDYQIDDIIELINHKYISIRKDKTLKINNVNELTVIEHLYNFDVLSFHHLESIYQNVVMKLEKKGVCYFYSNLFTKEESEYFNYYLNNREFQNGPALRNNYMHSTQPDPMNDNLHKTNYYYLLYLLFLVTIKINDELCLTKNEIK